MGLKIKSTGLGSGKGWRNEPIRHGLARKGVKTGVQKLKKDALIYVKDTAENRDNLQKDIKKVKNIKSVSEWVKWADDNAYDKNSATKLLFKAGVKKPPKKFYEINWDT